jgi:hypothetical protein
MAEPIHQVLRVRRLELLDGRGTVRAVLAIVPTTDEGAAALVLNDPGGRERVHLSCDGEAAVIELVQDGDAVLSLSSTRS